MKESEILKILEEYSKKIDFNSIPNAYSKEFYSLGIENNAIKSVGLQNTSPIQQAFNLKTYKLKYETIKNLKEIIENNITFEDIFNRIEKFRGNK